MLVDDERRDFMRLIAQADVTIKRTDSGETLVARMTNLSASGCAFTSDYGFSIGEPLEITVRGTSDRLDPLRRTARVVRCTQADGRHLVGVGFDTDHDE